MLEDGNVKDTTVDPFIAIFLDGDYKSIDLVPIKDIVNNFCEQNNIKIKPESSPRLLALWSRPKLVWRIIHQNKRDSILINNKEIKKIKEFINTLSNLQKSSKVGLIVSKSIDQALHPTNSIEIETTKLSRGYELLCSSTRKFNLDKVPFSIIFTK